MAQRYNKYGVAQGNSFVVNTYTSGAQKDVAVAMDNYGDFVVVWAGEGTEDNSGVYARVYDSFGNAVTGQFLVNSTVTNVQDMPNVAMDADGDFVVTWTAYVTTDSSMDANVYARCYNVQGVAKTGEIVVNTNQAHYQENSDVAMDADGDFVVVWQSDQQDGNNWGVYAQRFSAAGTKKGSEFRVNTYTLNKQMDPAVANGRRRRFRHRVAELQPGRQRLRRLCPTIHLRRREVRLGIPRQLVYDRLSIPTRHCHEQCRRVHGHLGQLRTGQHIQQAGHAHEGLRHLCAIYKLNGTVNYSEFRVNGMTAGNQVTPAVAMSADDRIVAAWVGPDFAKSSDENIYSRIMKMDTTPPTIGAVSVIQSNASLRSTAMTSAQSLVMIWNVNDTGGSGLNTVTLKVDGVAKTPTSSAAVSGKNYSMSLGACSAGKHTYTITHGSCGQHPNLHGNVHRVADNPTISGVSVAVAKGVISWNVKDAEGVGGSTLRSMA